MKEQKDNIEQYLSCIKYTPKQDIANKMNISEREVRRKISDLKMKRVVIFSSQTKGYRLAREYRSMSKTEREEEKRQVQHSLNECKCRTNILNKHKRKYIAYLKKAEQIDMEEENYQHIPRID